MTTEANETSGQLEFKFLWNRAEYCRLYRAVQREARRRSKVWLFLSVWFGLVAMIAAVSVLHAQDALTAAIDVLPIIVLIGLWIVLDRWGFAQFSARSYARTHAQCIPHDQVRVLTADGVRARCVTSDVFVQWSGISGVRETPEFFLFFTTPSCAIELPKRAVGDPSFVRSWLSDHASVLFLTAPKPVSSSPPP